MILRLGVWLVVLCTGLTTALESHPCPCIPRNLCPRVFGASPVDEKVTGPMKPCSDPGTVHCCGTSVSLQEQQPIHIVVADEKKREEQLMEFVSNAIEQMNKQHSVVDIQREEKSFDNTKKNNFGCNEKHCSDISDEKNKQLNETNKNSLTVTDHKVLINSSNIIFSHPKLSEVISENGTVEKVYIVYAETQNKNNAYLAKEKNAQIVLPTKERKQENLTVRESTTEENENEPQESSIDQIQVVTGVEGNPDESLTHTKSKPSRFQIKNQLHHRKSNRLQKLFPKRRPPSPVPSKNPQDGDEKQQGGDDVEIAESNLDEVRDTETTGVAEDYPDEEDVYDEDVSTDKEFQKEDSLPPVPTNFQNKTEQTDSRRLSLPPRRLTPQLTRPEENKHNTKNALALLRSRTKSRNDPTVHKPSEESAKITQQEPVGEYVIMKMDEINVRAINNMMKTNFTSRSSLRSNTASKSPQAPLKSTNNRIVSSLNRNNQEPKSTESPSRTRRPSSQNNLHLQPKPQTQTPSLTNQQSTNQGTGMSQESTVHRFQLKGRPTLKPLNTKLPSTLASPISMTQEPAFDTSKTTPNARRQQFNRLRTRTQVTQNTAEKPSVPQSSQNSEDPTTLAPSMPLFARKRLPSRERLRPRVEQNTNTYKNKQNEELETETQKTISKTLLHSRTANEEDKISNDDEFIGSPIKSGQDLDGSGSDFDFQQARGNGKFIAPSELETGFRPMPPMMESRSLKVVGPLPGGFHDSASGFSEGDQIGLELPKPDFQNQFNNEGSFNQNHRHSSLLPPVFPSVTHHQNQFKSQGSLNQNTRPLSLLPPAFTVTRPQVSTISQFSPKIPAPEPEQFFELEEATPQFEEQEGGGDLAQIQNQFGNLKNQYDTLLNRYAETLNTYIGQYKKLINSAPPIIR